MFSKIKSRTTTDPAPPAPLVVEPLPRRAPRTVSLIAQGVTIKGSLRGEGEMHIDGVVRGDVKVSRLTIGESGQIEGAIVAESVECRGRVVGSIIARQVRLYETSHVDGDVTHEELAMETGAFFQGRSLKFQRQALAGPDTPNETADATSQPEATTS